MEAVRNDGAEGEYVNYPPPIRNHGQGIHRFSRLLARLQLNGNPRPRIPVALLQRKLEMIEKGG